MLEALAKVVLVVLVIPLLFAADVPENVIRISDLKDNSDIQSLDGSIPPLSDVRVDEQDGVQLTFDMTPKVPSSQVFGKVARSPLTDEYAIGFAVIQGRVLKGDSPANAMLQGAHPLEDGINHWRFVGLKGSFGCGMSDLERFGSGWKLNGLYLTSNGNLAGRGALKTGFARHIPDDPVIDWFMEVAENTLNAYVNINGVPQGHAFNLTFPDPLGIANLRPMISFNPDTKDPSYVLFYQFRAVSSTRGSSALYHQNAAPSLRHTAWVLADQPEARLLVTDGKVTVKVANIISCRADFFPDGQIEVKSSPVSTRMLPPENLQKLELLMTEMITSLQSWSLDADTLRLHSNIGINTWIPADSDDPVSTNPFVTQ